MRVERASKRHAHVLPVRFEPPLTLSHHHVSSKGSKADEKAPEELGSSTTPWEGGGDADEEDLSDNLEELEPVCERRGSNVWKDEMSRQNEEPRRRHTARCDAHLGTTASSVCVV